MAFTKLCTDTGIDTPKCEALREIISQCLGSLDVIERQMTLIDGKLFGVKPEPCENLAKNAQDPSLETLSLALRERLRRAQEFTGAISDRI